MSDPILKPAVHGHTSHGLGPAHEGHAEPGNIARDGAPKKVHSVAIHGGMSKQTKSGYVAFGGDHASAIDSLSGNTVPAANMAAPGWGNAGVQSGHPFAKAPASKVARPTPPSFGQRSRTAPHSAELGAAILQEAFKNSASDDCVAHGRKRDGSK
jgi:hypothetical protein